jgi:hypothetical protein
MDDKNTKGKTSMIDDCYVWMCYNNDGELSLDERVTIVSNAFEKRFGRRPNRCLVHPSMIHNLPDESQPKIINGVEIRSNSIVQRNNFYMG